MIYIDWALQAQYTNNVICIQIEPVILDVFHLPLGIIAPACSSLGGGQPPFSGSYDNATSLHARGLPDSQPMITFWINDRI
ncbi:MAG: hypothetical protein HN725_20645 [Alphaproteobacteria bacterium]|jgi:hypothetical protein|nr:hypothetical protein [Alphaproteobacteria bacterium]MBT4543424.1 hypothetical protein [Alphaproteobacteria bacterium]MBT7747709.1 hypothetical protein [Alphaproteobacteria bacterium]